MSVLWWPLLLKLHVNVGVSALPGNISISADDLSGKLVLMEVGRWVCTCKLLSFHVPTKCTLQVSCILVITRERLNWSLNTLQGDENKPFPYKTSAYAFKSQEWAPPLLTVLNRVGRKVTYMINWNTTIQNYYTTLNIVGSAETFCYSSINLPTDHSNNVDT